MRHTGDETIQDMIDYIGEEPTTKHHPNESLHLIAQRQELPARPRRR